jgi:anti-sigma B factor antagonist
MPETTTPSQRVPSANQVAVVTVTGQLDAAAAAELVAAISEEAQLKPLIALDLKDVSEADSAGLGALVRALKAARDAGGDLVIVRPQPSIARLLNEAGLDQLLRVFPDPAAASAALADSSVDSGWNIPNL